MTIKSSISGKRGLVLPNDRCAENCLVPGLSRLMTTISTMKHALDMTDHAICEFVQQQKMSSIEALASGIAHDLKGALMTLGLSTARLKDFDMPSNAIKYIDVLTKATDSLRGIVERLDSLKGVEDADKLHCLDMGIETLTTIEVIKESIPPHIILHKPMWSKPLPVKVAQGDIWSILQNLVLNAVEAMPDGGDLLINISKTTVDHLYCFKHGNARTGEYATLTVSDHGYGIPENILARIFDPMFSTKQVSENGQRGWGLSVVYSLVSRRGGWIDVQSKPGQGTDFEVFLPIYSPVGNAEG